MHLDYTVPFAAGLALALAGTTAILVRLLARAGARLLGRTRRPRLGFAAPAIVGLGALLAWGSLRACGATAIHAATDLVMAAAPRPPRGWRADLAVPAPYTILAGDLHCHIRPPDWAEHVARGLPETIDLARAEGLDFVSLIPHTFTGFFAD